MCPNLNLTFQTSKVNRMKTNRKANVLRELATRSGNRSRIDRLQSMVVCLGDRLEVGEEELWAWRSAIVAGEAGQTVDFKVIQAIGFEANWMIMAEERLFQMCCLVADAWNQCWEDEVDDSEGWVVDRVAALVEDRVVAAFRYAVEVILPIRAE